MLIEMRTYTFHPGNVDGFLRLYETEGLALQKSILGRMVGYFTTDIGPLNQIVHLWAYADLKEREDRRRQLAGDAGWRAYLAKVLPLIRTMDSKILVPTSFSPIQ